MFQGKDKAEAQAQAQAQAQVQVQAQELRQAQQGKRTQVATGQESG